MKLPPVAITRGDVKELSEFIQRLIVESYHSTAPLSVLNLVIPGSGLLGLCAVVPTGSLIKPVSLIEVFFKIAIDLLL